MTHLITRSRQLFQELVASDCDGPSTEHVHNWIMLQKNDNTTDEEAKMSVTLLHQAVLLAVNKLVREMWIEQCRGHKLLLPYDSSMLVTMWAFCKDQHSLWFRANFEKRVVKDLPANPELLEPLILFMIGTLGFGKTFNTYTVNLKLTQWVARGDLTAHGEKIKELVDSRTSAYYCEV